MTVSHQDSLDDPRREAGADRLLPLAAAPTFAAMALMTAFHGASETDMLCSAAPGASPLGGMAAMYVLMSVFHASPWLRLIASRPSNGPPSA